MDYMAIASYGVYPTPTPTGKARAAFGVSMGLIDFVLGEDLSSSIVKGMLNIGKQGIRFITGILRIGENG